MPTIHELFRDALDATAEDIQGKVLRIEATQDGTVCAVYEKDDKTRYYRADQYDVRGPFDNGRLVRVQSYCTMVRGGMNPAFQGEQLWGEYWHEIVGEVAE